jgi:thiopurine S-methyltransferase
MEREFWFERWREGRTPFNEGAPNLFLTKFAGRLAGYQRILVPLCGKAEDLAYLAADHDVVGIELVEDAVKQFFAEHELEPTSVMTYSDTLKVYRAAQLRIIAGDFFATTPELVGPIDAVYDRAALVALPPEMRARYAKHLRAIAPDARRQLIVALEYPPGAMEGPPFSVTEAELRALYPDGTLEHLDEAPYLASNGNLVRHCYELRF